MLALASVEHVFRQDDYSLAGSFNFNYVDTEYRKSLPMGTYSGTGQIAWTSPQQGTASFTGSAIGQATDDVFGLGTWRSCSRHTIRDEGRFDLRLNADSQQVTVTRANSTSVAYTQYTDLLYGYCTAADNPAWSFFFNGVESKYAGTFDAGAHAILLGYHATSPKSDVDSTAVPIDWSTTAAADFSVSAVPNNGTPQIPTDWQELPQPEGTPNNQALDAQHGAVTVTVNVSGTPRKAPSGDVSKSVARIQLFWASTTTSAATVEEIPVTASSGLWGVHWNSRQVVAHVGSLPTAPPWAQFVKVQVAAEGFQESNVANNTAYVGIETFAAENPRSRNVPADSFLDESTGSVLGPADAARYPDVTVWAYKPITRLGGSVQIDNATGGFYYTPLATSEVQALAPGEVLEDRIDFLAIENHTFVDAAYRVIPVVGVNDDPVTEFDHVQTVDNRLLTMRALELLRNDHDVDHGDTLRIDHLDEFSSYGAQVTLTADGMIEYDPRDVASIRALNSGEQLTDYFGYDVIDRFGGTATGYVEITVAGANDPPEVLALASVAAELDATVPPIAIHVRDWESTPDQYVVSVEPAFSNLLDASGLELTGGGSDWQLTATPRTGQTGRVRVDVKISVPDGGTGSGSFFLVIGDAADTDLDGISNSLENQGNETGDANGDGLQDALQPYIVSFPAQSSPSRWLLATLPSCALDDVHVQAVPAATGVAQSADFPAGGFAYRIQIGALGGSATLSLKQDGTNSLNAYFQFDGSAGATGPAWKWLMWNGQDGAKVYSDHIELVVRDGGQGDADGEANGIITGYAAPSHVLHPWQNRVLSLDVDHDGAVAPIDALLVINFINGETNFQLPELPAAGQVLSLFLDTTGDDIVAPLDALLIVNRLNGAGTPEGEPKAEGEFEREMEVRAGSEEAAVDGARGAFAKDEFRVDVSGPQAATATNVAPHARLPETARTSVVPPAVLREVRRAEGLSLRGTLVKKLSGEENCSADPTHSGAAIVDELLAADIARAWSARR